MSARAILFLQGSSGPGGSKRSLLGMIAALRGTEFQPVIACPDEGWLTEQLRESGVPFVLVPFYAWRKLWERPRVRPSISRRWLPALARWNFALVHSNEFWWAPHAVQVARRLRIPAVVHLRDGHHTLKKARQYRLDEAETVLAVSSELREQFAGDAALTARTEILFNSCELEHDARADNREAQRRLLGIAPGIVAIGNAGRICARKNQQLLVRALAVLKEEKDVPPVRVYFAGQADDDYASALKSEIRRLGLTDIMHFLGNVGDMSGFYAAMDLIVHCASREGLPRVVPEAMLAGKPVVATAAQGVRDAIPNERCGWVVPVDDETALAAALREALPEGSLREAVAAAGAAHAARLFTLERQRERLTALYRRLTDGL